MGGMYEPVHSEAQSILMAAWRQDPRQDQILLPSGNLIENFLKLEEDKAGCWHEANGTRTWLPLELHVALPPAGRVQIPDELDLDTTFEMASTGSLPAIKRSLRCHQTAAESVNAPSVDVVSSRRRMRTLF